MVDEMPIRDSDCAATHGERAEGIFRSGLNCCQAVLMAYAEEYGLSKDDAVRLGSAFGGGMGGMGLTCGAVTGAVMVIGLRQPRKDNKGATEWDLARRLSRLFCEKNASTRCSDLLGRDISTPEGYAEARDNRLFKSICPKMVHDAAEILEQVL